MNPVIPLVLAVFTVSVGYGVVLPLLPDLVARLLPVGAAQARVSWHTGMLTAAYSLALFLAAPAWGLLSDSYGRRRVLLTALMGFGLATIAFSLVDTVGGVYLQRFLSGLFAAAATPIAAATVGDLPLTDDQRGRRFAYISMASVAGFLVGPTLGVLVTRVGAEIVTTSSRASALTMPLSSMAVLTAVVSVVVALAVPRTTRVPLVGGRAVPTKRRPSSVVVRLLLLAFIVSGGIGAFEVGLALRGAQVLDLSAYQIAVMYTECSLVMLSVQGLVFSPLVGARQTRRLIAPGLLAFAAGLALVPWAFSFGLMLSVIGAVAASAGILTPILTYWISMAAGSAQGWQLGRQTAAASLGVTSGSAAGGVLFNLAIVPGSSFVLASALVGLGFLLSLPLARTVTSGRSSLPDGL